jgi:hypothetical protein
MNLDQIIARFCTLREQTSGGTEVFGFNDADGCLAIKGIEIMECDDEIPDFINIITD